MNSLPDKPYFNPHELAQILDEPLRTVYYWLQHNHINHIHRGRKTLIPKQEVEYILKNGFTCTDCQ